MTRSKIGRPAHVPTDETRNLVEALSGFGIPQDEIARLVGVDPKTLRFHYADQIELGIVRRQNIWLRKRRRLAECRPRLEVDVKRRSCGAASAVVG